MQDRLEEVIAKSKLKQFSFTPTSHQTLELISYRTFTESDIQAIRDFQAAILQRLNIKLVVVGGGYGCTKIVVSLDGASPQEARNLIQQLLENPIFREEAVKIDFEIIIARDPQTRVDLRRGTSESSLNGSEILVFYSYAHEDEEYKGMLDKHLSILQKQGFIRVWHNRKIMAGAEWENEINNNLENATIILLLVSVDFLASDYCYGKEMAHAIDRHNAGKARVIPVIVRPVDWELAPFAKLQVIPQDGRAITSWNNQDEAWTFVAKEIRKAIQTTQA